MNSKINKKLEVKGNIKAKIPAITQTNRAFIALSLKYFPKVSVIPVRPFSFLGMYIFIK
jgi:hypothetical protein